MAKVWERPSTRSSIHALGMRLARTGAWKDRRAIGSILDALKGSAEAATLNWDAKNYTKALQWCEEIAKESKQLRLALREAKSHTDKLCREQGGKD